MNNNNIDNASPSKKAPKQKQIILKNPFHPLDLSAHDLLAIYKKFQISGQINRNPKQQIPIQTITQLIAALKGCKPSYIQKCLSQALIKDTISWNQFLAFLDQESQVRIKILDWLLHEKSIIKYRFQCQLPFRQKVVNTYESISGINFLKVGEDKLMLVDVDCKKMFLVLLTDGKFQVIDQFIHKNKKQQQQSINQNYHENQTNPKNLKNNKNADIMKVGLDRSLRIRRNKDKGSLLQNKSMLKSERLIPQQEQNQHFMLTTSTYRSGEEEIFYKKERKNIHTLFSLFNQLPLEQSVKVARQASQIIENRAVSASSALKIKQKFQGYISEKKPQMRSVMKKQQKPIDSARKKLLWLNQQRNNLSYNPYKPYRISSKIDTEFHQNTFQVIKKLQRDRKQKQYILQSNHKKFCQQLNCMGLVYYNMELCIVKVAKQYNKINLQLQDSLKIDKESDHKKNQVIEMIQFYFHRATTRWFILVLFRTQFKNQTKQKCMNESYVKGYEIELCDIKWRNQKKYKFKNKKKQQFVIDLGKNQIIRMLTQKQYGLHFISHNGKYCTWKQHYQKLQDESIIFWKKDLEQKFKGTTLSLSCLSICSKINRAVLGTIKGIIAIYDLIGKNYKLHKISTHPILQIEIYEQRAYILCQRQKLIIYDILRMEQIQNLSVRNQQKLHEKIQKFMISQGKIYCYGSVIRVFEKFVDQSLQQEKFKMQNNYTWRLNKLDKSKGKTSPFLKVIPTFRKQKTNAQLLVRSQNLFIILTQIQQAIFYSISNMQVKFTTIIDVPHDEKIMRITISPDEKLLAVLLFNQNIYVFNIYTQDQTLFMKSTPYKKYTSLCFLDRKNQYLLACGTETGKIILIPLGYTPEKETKSLQLHLKPLSMLTLKNELLISASQNQDMAIWQLPFNVIKHQIKLKGKLPASDFIVQKLGFHQDYAFFRSYQGVIVQVNTTKGQLKSINSQFTNWSHISVDVIMNYVIGVQKPGQLLVMQRKNDKQSWSLYRKFQIDSKHEIISIGIIQSQKSVFFAKTGLYIWNYKNQKLSKFKSYLQSIV